MIITINLKSNPNFIKKVFDDKLKFFNKLVKLFSTHVSDEHRKKLFRILNYLFLEEYKMIYFREEGDQALEELFIHQQTKFSKTNIKNFFYHF